MEGTTESELPYKVEYLAVLFIYVGKGTAESPFISNISLCKNVFFSVLDKSKQT